MQFKNFKARRVEITVAKKSEVAEYKRQASCYHETRTDRLNIFDSPDVHFLAVKDEEGKQIGLMRVDEIDSNTAQIAGISIPNKAWRDRYGTEVVHQFLKHCKTDNICKKLYLKDGNTILDAYKKERPNFFKYSCSPIEVCKVS